MRTVDRIAIRAPLALVFSAARDIERWPAILPHYRWVRFLERSADGGTVEMAARRPFGPIAWPTWWVSEMRVLPEQREIRYRHVRGITRGMDVVWRVGTGRGTGEGGSVEVEVIHTWDGPSWSIIGKVAAALVIGPVFVHGIARRTLAGIKRFAEQGEEATS
jgi:hypothetical protein